MDRFDQSLQWEKLELVTISGVVAILKYDKHTEEELFC